MRHLILMLVLLLTAGVTAVGADDDSEYQADTFAIAADGKELSASIARLSGIAPFFHLYDIQGNPLEVIANPHLDLEFGIGPAAAATLGDKGVTVLVGGMAGPKMKDVLDAKQVRFVRRIGTVQDVVSELRE